MHPRFLARLTAMCALIATIFGIPSSAMGSTIRELPPLEGEIIIDGIIHPGTRIHPMFQFPNGKLIEFRQDWTVADNREFTKNVLRFSNYNELTIPDNWDGKYMVCEITLDGYNGTIRTGTFRAAHLYAFSTWVTTDTTHAYKCRYCDKTLQPEPHDFGKEVISMNPTCVEPGEAAKTCATCKYTKTITIPPLNHTWSEPTYEWGSDHSTCIAKRICEHDSNHVETCEGQVTSKVTKPAGHGSKGETTYTAEFGLEWASKQTVTIANIDELVKPNQKPENQESDNQANASISDTASNTGCDKTSPSLPQTGDPIMTSVTFVAATSMLFCLGARHARP